MEPVTPVLTFPGHSGGLWLHRPWASIIHAPWQGRSQQKIGPFRPLIFKGFVELSSHF